MSGPIDTSRLEAILAKVSRHRHITLRRAFLRVAGPFPVAGPASWSNDWHAFRPCPFPHLHEGLDIFAARGTPVVASADASVTQLIDDPVTGLGVQLTDDHGTEYLYAHLSAFAPALLAGDHVRVGEMLGQVGNTGDASGGATHLHFQVQPGGIPMPPKPLVDRWLRGETCRARRLLRGRRLAHRAHLPPWWWRSLVEEGRSVALAGPAPGSLVRWERPTKPTSQRSSLDAPVAFVGTLGGILVFAFVVRRRDLAAKRNAVW